VVREKYNFFKIKNFNPFFGPVEILFSCDSFRLIGYLGGEPLSHPEGEAVQGVHTLDPPYF
jgi:hypothetical protein